MSGLYRGPNSSAVADALNIDGNKGDLTIENSGLEWTINPKVVTYPKIQDVNADTLLGQTGTTGTVQEIPCTPAGRALLDDADASAQRTTLGLGNAATATIGTGVLAYDANLQGFVDTFTLPTIDGTNGQVLSTDGAGNLFLASPSGIPDADFGDITVSASATVWTINNDAVTSNKIADASVTTNKIDDDAVTTVKILDANITTDKIADSNVTGQKIVDDVVLPGLEGVKIPVGTTAQRPVTPTDGYIRYNTDLLTYEGYSNGDWGSIGGGATGGSTDNIFYLNDQTVTTSYTIPTGQNAMTAGAITINDDVLVTVPDGSTWTIV
jgi:hypothetical protein